MRRSFLPVLALAGAGCIGTGTEIGNPGATTTTASVGLTAFSSDATSVVLPLPAAGGAGGSGPIQIAEAWVSVHKIELVREDACGGAEERELEIRGLVGDLAAGPLLSELKVPITDYCEVKVEMRRPEDGVDSPLGEDVIQITGLRADGTPFDLATRREFELELESRGMAFTIDQARAALLIAFDAQRWFDGVPLDEAEVTGNHIRIDASHNTALLAAFEANVARSLGVYRDHDEDGHVDDDERERVAGDD